VDDADILTGMLDSMQRQFDEPAVAVVVGDHAFELQMQLYEADLNDILGSVSTLSGGGRMLKFSTEAIQRMDDHTMVGVMNSLRVKYRHMIICANMPDVLQKLAFLARMHQTFLLASDAADAQRILDLAGSDVINVL